MASRLIELEGGILVEIEVSEDEIVPISSKSAKKIDQSISSIKPILVKTAKPIAEAWSELSKDLTIESAEIELGLSFEVEGNVYVTKAKAGSNLSIKLKLKPK